MERLSSRVNKNVSWRMFACYFKQKLSVVMEWGSPLNKVDNSMLAHIYQSCFPCFVSSDFKYQFEFLFTNYMENRLIKGYQLTTLPCLGRPLVSVFNI